MTSEEQANDTPPNDTPTPSSNGTTSPPPPTSAVTLASPDSVPLQAPSSDDASAHPGGATRIEGGMMRRPLPRFRSHKVVEAAKINEVRSMPADGASGGQLVLLLLVPNGEVGGTTTVDVSADYMRKHDPAPGGYFVRYAGGYESYSPAEAFESGYNLEKEAGPEPAARREITRHRFDEANGNRELVLEVLDDPGAGGACHHYKVTGFDSASNPSCPFMARHGAPAKHSTILFQNGPITEIGGTNGVTHEVLLAVIEDRLTAFQKGRHACEENQNALMYVQHALAWLKKRTERRLAAGTEGTHEGS